MDIQIVATDVDGTLLDSNHELPKENLEVIKEVKSVGKHVVIATGRPPLEVHSLLEEIGLPLPIICANGAVILDEIGKEIAKDCLSTEDVRKAIYALDCNGFYQEIYTSKGNFIKDFRNPKHANEMLKVMLETHPNRTMEGLIAFLNERINRGALFLVDDYEEILCRGDIEYYKIFGVHSSDSTIEKVKNIIEDEFNLAVTTSWSNNIEINTLTASKGNALLTYAKLLGCKRNQTMAIGDYLNDLPMLEAAGISIAMGNAHQMIKEKCDFVTGTNNEGGWSNAIRKFMLENRM
ncbi:MAG: family phosphatase [Bacillales bacterium]|jgi:Cof subfamily protein (haloacid dehalogenase superfamily)|nr:family phosphatase [Bacillales bacterium]